MRDISRFRWCNGERWHRDRRDDLLHLGICRSPLFHVHAHLEPVSPPVSLITGLGLIRRTQNRSDPGTAW